MLPCLQTLLPRILIPVSLMLAACAPERAPPLPPLDLGGLSPTMQAQIDAALMRLDGAPADALANGEAAMLLDAYDKTEAAAALYARARHYAPEAFRWVYLHAHALAELGQAERARESLLAALALRPGYPAAELALARLQLQAGERAAARTRLGALLARNPAYAEAQVVYAALLLEDQEYDYAIVVLQRALALASHYGQAHHLLARAYRATGDDTQAETHLALFERYRLFRPAFNDPVRREVELLDKSALSRPQRGLEQLARGEYHVAIATFEAMAAEDPEAAAPHVNLIAAYAQLGDYAAAERHAQLAAQRGSDDVKLHNNLGILRLRQRRFDDAGAAFRRALAIDPDYAAAHRNLAAALAADDQPGAAIAAYERALALEPTDRTTRYRFGELLQQQGHAAQAVSVLEPLTVVTLAETPLHLLLLGRAQLEAGRADVALATLRRAQRLAQSHGVEGAALEIDRLIRRASAVSAR